MGKVLTNVPGVNFARKCYRQQERAVSNNWRAWVKDPDRQERRIADISAKQKSLSGGKSGMTRRPSVDKVKSAIIKQAKKLILGKQNAGELPAELIAVFNAAIKKESGERKELHVYTGVQDDGHGHIVYDIQNDQIVYYRPAVMG